MADALARLWTKFLPDIEQRVALLEAAAKALAASELSDEQRVVAHGAAHKLAGTLGTFGMPRGTEVARKTEWLLVENPAADAAAELTGWAAELRMLVDGRK